MTDQLDRLKAALADRYVLERELGAVGMARRTVGRYDGRTVGEPA
jgi:hypothetical protein